MIAEPCDPSCDEANAGDAGPSRCAGSLPILREPMTASEPGERALDGPAPRQDLEACPSSNEANPPLNRTQNSPKSFDDGHRDRLCTNITSGLLCGG